MTCKGCNSDIEDHHCPACHQCAECCFDDWTHDTAPVLQGGQT